MEQAYLSDKEQFTKTKQRYLRYRIRKKLSRDAAAASRDDINEPDQASRVVAAGHFYAPWSGLAFQQQQQQQPPLEMEGWTPFKALQFKQFLLQRMNDKTAGDRLRYAKQYAHVLLRCSDPNILLQLSPGKRIHAMKAFSCLAKFTGQYDEWLAIKRGYNLTWTEGSNEALATFERFFVVLSISSYWNDDYDDDDNSRQ
jgi:hypothetical protein